MLNKLLVSIYKSINLFYRMFRYEHKNIEWEENFGFLPIFISSSVHIFSPIKAWRPPELPPNYALTHPNRVE